MAFQGLEVIHRHVVYAPFALAFVLVIKLHVVPDQIVFNVCLEALTKNKFSKILSG